MQNRITIVLLGLALGVACSDRTTHTDEEALKICTTYCERFDECDVPLEGEDATTESCAETCASYDWAWRRGCREEEKALYACTNALSCEDFALSEDFNASGPKPCEEEREASSVCIANHGGIDEEG